MRWTVVLMVVVGLAAPLGAEQAASPELIARWERLILREADRLSEYLGNGRPTLLGFVDKSCAYCLSMVPILEELRRDQGDRINIITVDPEQSALKVRLLIQKYQVWAVPMFVLFDRRGNVAGNLYGPQARARLVAKLTVLAASEDSHGK